VKYHTSGTPAEYRFEYHANWSNAPKIRAIQSVRNPRKLGASGHLFEIAMAKVEGSNPFIRFIEGVC
jgi:hypothetical protein